MKKHKGFTLIEILVVISIASFLVTLGISSYMDFNRRQVLDQVAKNIVNDLRDLQSKASSGDKGPANTCSNALKGWYFKIIDSAHYSLYGNCGSDFSLKTVNLPANINIVSPVAGTTVLFKPLNLGIDQNISIIVQYASDSTRQQSINLTTGGTIQTTSTSGVVPVNTPTPIITPTNTPVPTATPTTALVNTPTPTPTIPCSPFSSPCSLPGQCCSGICTSSRCALGGPGI